MIRTHQTIVRKYSFPHKLTLRNIFAFYIKRWNLHKSPAGFFFSFDTHTHVYRKKYKRNACPLLNKYIPKNACVLNSHICKCIYVCLCSASTSLCRIWLEKTKLKYTRVDNELYARLDHHTPPYAIYIWVKLLFHTFVCSLLSCTTYTA